MLLTNGTDEAIQVLVNTYVDDGDEVIILRPSYAMYRFYAEVAGANIREIDYTPGTLAFPLAQLLDSISPITRAILIANPNNPTGTAITIPAIRQILERTPQAAVLIDEAYYEFSGITALPLVKDYPNLFVSRTFSKVYGMAAMRIGCLFSQAANVLTCTKPSRHTALICSPRWPPKLLCRIRSMSRTTSPKRWWHARSCVRA